MIYVRSQQSVVKQEDLGFRACPTCGQDRRFSLCLVYSHSDLWLIFGKVDKKQYFELCEICGRGPEVSAAAAEARIGRVPIPFMQRFGCLGLILAFFLLAGVTIVMGFINEKKEAEIERIRQEAKRARLEQSVGGDSGKAADGLTRIASTLTFCGRRDRWQERR